MGLVATMVALVLGLLIAAAKDKYDKESAGVTQMAAKVIFLDRMLANYGPEANDVRVQLGKMVETVRNRMWPGHLLSGAQLDPNASRSEAVLISLQNLRAEKRSADNAQIARLIGRVRTWSSALAGI